MKTKLPLYLALLLLTQCSKCKTDDPAPVAPNPVDALPPATQPGQRTFGCLLNGQPWTQSENPFSGQIFSTQYFSGNLLISCPGVSKQGQANTYQHIRFELDSVYMVGVYNIDGLRNKTLKLMGTNCTWEASSALPATLQLTRFDLVNRIVSGTFSFTLEKPGCGRVVVTDGRFDSRF